MRLLLAEDTVDLSNALCAVLRHDGYEVDAAYDGVQATELIDAGGYDGIILDIMMPRKDGMQVLRELRAMNITTPVLMLTAKTELNDKVDGLEAGADDYLTKPFAMRELLARVHSMTRRAGDYSDKELRFGSLTLRSGTYELSAENSVRLSVKEFELMRALMLAGGRELGARYLFDNVWGGEKDASPDVVRVYISFLRTKLASVSADCVIRGEKDGPFCLARTGV